MPFKIYEKDESGKLTKTYVSAAGGSVTASTSSITQKRAIETISLQTSRPDRLLVQVLNVFLPAGYPASVSDDYLEYQIYDSLQAFSSSIAGLLASRAVLEGIGVGQASASPTTALLLSVLQDSTGRLATILFAYRLGTALEPECKMYRLAADVFNDAAMILDCLSPSLPSLPRVILLSVSSILRSLCGVAAGSAKASLSAHFAMNGNLGELNAKDSSQETVISLMGMLTGTFVVSWVSTPLATWVTLLVLLAIHLFTNRAAVRAVRMKTLNRQRACLALSPLLGPSLPVNAPGPREVAEKEIIFERDGALRWAGGPIVGYAKIGVGLDKILASLAKDERRSDQTHHSFPTIEDLLDLFRDDRYIIWFESRTRTCLLVIKEGATPRDQLKAWSIALQVAQKWNARVQKQNQSTSSSTGLFDMMKSARKELEGRWDQVLEKISVAGWDVETGILETHGSCRIGFHSD